MAWLVFTSHSLQWNTFLEKTKKTVYNQVNKKQNGKQDYLKHVIFLTWKDINSKNRTTFQVIQTLRGFCLACLTLNLIAHIWFIACSTNHLICKTSLHWSRFCIKVKTETLLVLVNFVATVNSCSLHYISK